MPTNTQENTGRLRMSTSAQTVTVTATGAYAAPDYATRIVVNAAGTVTVTLPPAAVLSGQEITIEDRTVNDVVVVTTEAGNVTLSAVGDILVVRSNGVKWLTVGSKIA